MQPKIVLNYPAFLEIGRSHNARRDVLLFAHVESQPSLMRPGNVLISEKFAGALRGAAIINTWELRTVYGRYARARYPNAKGSPTP